MADYLRRVVDAELDVLLPGLPAISLDGPKGVGKTATALRRAATVHRLDDPVRRGALAADLDRLVVGARPVLIDEWQRLPASWDAVRRAVDDDRSPGRFLLTGSAAPLEQPTHSGAGRIVTLRMRPLSLTERALIAPTVSLAELLTGRRPAVAGSSWLRLADYAEEVVASGLPGLRNGSPRIRRAGLDGYLDRIVEREFADQERTVRDPEALRRWMTAYAAATATTASYETIRAAAGSGEGRVPARFTTHRLGRGHHRPRGLSAPRRNRRGPGGAARPLSGPHARRAAEGDKSLAAELVQRRISSSGVRSGGGTRGGGAGIRWVIKGC